MKYNVEILDDDRMPDEMGGILVRDRQSGRIQIRLNAGHDHIDRLVSAYHEITHLLDNDLDDEKRTARESEVRCEGNLALAAEQILREYNMHDRQPVDSDALFSALTALADKKGLCIEFKPLRAHDGMLYERKIAIRDGLRGSMLAATTLAHEIGHAYLHSGNVIGDQEAEKQADALAACLIDLIGILDGLPDEPRNLIITKYVMAITDLYR